ncbi:MAG: AMP-binding protein [Pseudomonadota bacterium]
MTTSSWVHDLIAGKPADAVAIIDGDGQRATYGALEAMSQTLADALASHGVRGGDRVMLISENSIPYGVAILAISRLKAWVLPVNARQSPDEISAIAAHADARCMIVTHTTSPAAAHHAERLGAATLTDLDCGPIKVTAIDASTPEPVEDDPATQVGALMYTTGTTSAPKGVMLTHANLVWNAEISAGLRNMTADDLVLGVLPGTHIFGFSSTFLASLYAGCAIRFIPRFDPGAVLDAFADGASVMPAVPQMYERILTHMDATGRSLSAPRLHYISAGGAPLDPDWKERTERVFNLPLNNGYGLTETSPSVASTPQARPRTDTSVGYAVRDVSLAIKNPNANGVGELLIKGPGVMKGYYRNPDATRAVLEDDGTLHSGDLARMEEDGALFIVGRTKELIIRSGFNVYPPEVEAMLTKHPNVLQAAVVGRLKGGNEEILAFCLTKGAVEESPLKDWLHDRLVAYKVPQHIFLVEDFPTAATGKILKHKLIDHFSQTIAARDAATGSAP